MSTHLKLRSDLANAIKRGDDPATVADLRIRLREANLEKAIREAVDAAPPLTAEQRAKLAAILQSA